MLHGFTALYLNFQPIALTLDGEAQPCQSKRSKVLRTVLRELRLDMSSLSGYRQFLLAFGESRPSIPVPGANAANLF